MGNIKSNKGFTLIEILVSLVILGIMAMMLMPLFTGSISSIFAMGRGTQAMNHEAQMYMDQIYNSTNKPATISAINDLAGVAVDATQSLYGMTVVKITVDYNNNRQVTLTGLVP